MKKRRLIIFLIVPLLLVGCSSKTNALTSLSATTLASGQSLVAGSVTSISGNEIVLAVGTLPASQNTAGASASASASRSQNSSAAATGNSAASSATSSNSYVSGNSYNGTKLSSSSYVTFTGSDGNRVNGSGFGRSSTGSNNGPPAGAFANGGTLPSGFSANGGTPPSGLGANGGSPPSGLTNAAEAAPGASASAKSSTSSGSKTGSNTGTATSSITLTGEKMNLTIPVGTKVLMTSNGVLTTTTFGRIQANDIIEVILQTDANRAQTVIEAQIMG